MNLSKHFTLEELVRSQSAIRRCIDNTPNEVTIRNLILLCEKILEPLRMKIGRPVYVSSGYRSPELNTLIGGSPRSQHTKGEAADIEVAGMTAAEVFRYIIEESALPFDQVIEEFGEWVHISWSKNPRGHALLAFKNDEGETEYRRVL